jgi:hypothetical protein
MAAEQSSGEARESGLVKDVRVVPMSGEQVHLNVLRDGSHRAETTCTQYLNSLRLVYRLVAGNEKAELPSDIDWIKEASTIVNAVRERQNNTANAAWSPGSLCNKLTPLMAISKLRKWDEAYDQYFAAFLLAKNKQNNQTISQTPTQREQDNWIEMKKSRQKWKISEVKSDARSSTLTNSEDRWNGTTSRRSFSILYWPRIHSSHQNAEITAISLYRSRMVLSIAPKHRVCTSKPATC